jgi:antitoxin CcdA
MRQRTGGKRAAPKKSTNVSLPEGLVAEAKALGINLSSAAARGIRDAIAEQRAAEWLEENRAAIAAWNDHVDSEGVPLAPHRVF